MTNAELLKRADAIAVEAHTGRVDKAASLGEDYFNAIRRAGTNPIARAVKLGDLADNSDRKRLAVIDDRAKVRLAKYATAISMLNATG